MRYDADRAAAFYDEYGEREWTRFEDDRSSALSPAVHMDVLRRFVGPGDRVLDAGAGPGRFTIELAQMGARVLVADVSRVQLELNRAKLTEAGLEKSVDGWLQADITDLSALRDGEFDAVVDELLRVVRGSGHLLLSVMSLIGSVAPRSVI